MSADENQAESLLDDVEEENQGEMNTSAILNEEKDGNEEDAPMDDSTADGEKGDDKKEEEEEEKNDLQLRKHYPNFLSVHKLEFDDIKVILLELSDIWEDASLTIKYTRAKKGFMRMKFLREEDADAVFEKLKAKKINSKRLTFEMQKEGDNKSKNYQNNQQNKKGRFSSQQSRRNQQVNEKGKQDQRGRGGYNSSDMRGRQMQHRRQRWSPDRRQGRRPSQYMSRGRMDGGGRRQLMDGGGGGQWNQDGQNVTAALSQTSELLKGLTSLVGQQLLNPNQMSGQGDSQYGNQNWSQGIDQAGNYSAGYQSGGSGDQGYSNDSMNYGNYGGSSGGWGNSYRGYN